ncbi:MAG: methylamine dehydrogenase light chain [Pseudomonadales bacterium]
MQRQNQEKPLFDRATEALTRAVAKRTSRRGWLGLLGGTVVGAASVPLLPVARAAEPTQPQRAQIPESGDAQSCDYWRYCAIDGFLCSCCGGSVNTCPPGTEMSPITWIGTCENPLDGKKYVISYNDCCGKSGCGNCLCNRNEGDRPMYNPPKSNDLNWCLGTQSIIYNCSTAIVIGLAVE